MSEFVNSDAALALDERPATRTGWRDFKPLYTAQPACCCSAAPVVVVVLPFTDEELPVTDLLLCGHHFRASRGTLEAMETVVFDASGNLVLATRQWSDLGAGGTAEPGP